MNKKLSELEFFLNDNNCFFLKDHLLKYETYFKMGGKVKYYLKPITIEEFKLVVKYLNVNNLQFKIIGFTSNLILLDELEYSVIISTKNLTKVIFDGNNAIVEVGYSLQDFVRIAIMNQASGFEGLEGIPASIGGALFMNAGAYGSSISDNLVTVNCLDDSNNEITLSKEDCGFLYRDSIFKTGKYIILSAKFKFIKGEIKNIARNVEVFHIARHSYQDWVYPNLGSMISIPINSYQYIMRNNFYFSTKYFILKYLLKNPVVKFFNRKRPNNIAFNNLLLRYIHKNKKTTLKYSLSTKGSNILINDGSVETIEMINYIFMTYDLIDRKYHIENEIVLYPLYSVKTGFKNHYNNIVSKLKEQQ